MDNQITYDIIEKIEELWFYHQMDKIFNNIFLIIQIPLFVIFLIALYKINQVVKKYIENNK